MRFKKPSFKTKNSSTVAFSPSGKYLAQFGQRISIWNVEKGSICFEHKVIKNDSDIGFSNDDSLMFSKNTNGEIIVFETSTGKEISSTGKFKHYGEGSQPQFSSNSAVLFDPTWGEGLKVWSTRDCTLLDQYAFDGWSLSGLVKLPGTDLYSFAIRSKHPNPGFSKLFTFEENYECLEFKEIKPKDDRLRNKQDWFDIDTFGNCSFKNNWVISVKPPKRNEMIVIINANSHDASIIELDTPKESVFSLSSNGDVVAAVVHTNVYERGMSSAEYQALRDSTETEHLAFYCNDTHELICRIHWPDLNSAIFNPDGFGLALAGSKKSGYVHDYAELAQELTRLGKGRATARLC